MRNLIVFCTVWLLGLPAFAQTKITWKQLASIDFEEKYDEHTGALAYFPVFSPAMKALDQKEVSIKGYMLPVDPEQGLYILSRHPFSACFFCGSAGPESIIELVMRPGHPAYEMDETVTLMGMLELNGEDTEHCLYILKDARQP